MQADSKVEKTVSQNTEPEKVSTGTVITTGDSQFGTMLFNDNKQAIYIWELEESTKPECYGDCAELAEKVKKASIELYSQAAAIALEKGIIIADTKFEFGLIDGELVLCDEVLTPDSSRFWPAELWVPGQSTPSFDKQILRDVYQALYDEGKWDKKYPAPEVDQKHFELTRERYIEGFVRLTGSKPEFLKAA
jgi:phosphoribosylaminoimidazole-succinocarboxamide synthase